MLTYESGDLPDCWYRSVCSRPRGIGCTVLPWEIPRVLRRSHLRVTAFYFVHFQEESMDYLNHNQLDDWTYNKALQKITESYRVDGEIKAKIRSMKRKVM